MTKDQLLEKWAARGAIAAGHDTWMTPCYEENLAQGVGIDDLSSHSRQQWEATDYFQVLHGSKMYDDALEFFISLADGRYPDTENIIDLKMDLVDAFWDAWETEIGAADLIEAALANRPKVLADKMLDLLMVTERDGNQVVRFTDEAVTQRSAEYQLLVQWKTDNGRHALDFLFDQAYYMLDYVAANGLEDIEEGLPDSDIYTRDLLDWLAGNPRNVEYITVALQVGPYTSGHTLLQHAQCRAIGDIWLSLARVLEDTLE